jgi:AcrR family transcriptional regulator
MGDARVSSRISREERRSQIVAATVRLVGRYGLQGTTLTRVASEVGVTEMALYRHFQGKDDILAAAFEFLTERAARWMASSSHPWVPTRLREIGRDHFDMLTSDIEMWTAPMMQFAVSRSTQVHVAAEFVGVRPGDGQPTYIRHEGTREILARYLREGKAQGSIRPYVDVSAFALQWMSWAQGENFHYLLAEAEGLEANREPHLRVLDLIIADIELPQA